MTVNPGEVVKMVVNWVSEGQHVQQNVRPFRLGGLTPLPDSRVIDDLALMALEYITAGGASITNSSLLQSIDVYLATLAGDVLLGNKTVNVAGGDSGDRYAHGCAGLMTRRVGSSRGVSKVFVPNMSENRIIAGYLSSTAVGNLLSASIPLMTYVNAADYGNVGEYEPGSWDPNRPVPFLPLVGDVIVPLVVAYQRRRKPGVGL